MRILYFSMKLNQVENNFNNIYYKNTNGNKLMKLK